jgi:hypothetical protein
MDELRLLMQADEGAHGLLDRDPERVILVDPALRNTCGRMAAEIRIRRVGRSAALR